MKRTHAVRLLTLVILTVVLFLFWPEELPTLDLDDQEALKGIPWGLRDDPYKLASESDGHTFEWKHWVDLSSTPTAFFDLSSEVFPYLTTLRAYGDVEFPHTERSSQAEHALISMIYMLHHMPAPRQILEIGQKRRIHRVRSVSPAKRHRQYGLEPGFEEPVPLAPLAPNIWDVKAKIAMELDPELFHWDANAASLKGISVRGHAHTIQTALEDVPKSQKHFYELKLWCGIGNHYDWRFFRRALPLEQRGKVIHRMTDAWAEFVRQERFVAWYAHGSLLGWMWNGITLPWDSDNDVQMPIREVDRMARDYNGTLVVAGSGAYLIDVGPWYVERTTKSNTHNIIDARFIDIATGLYLDITALAANVSKKGFVSCKWPHHYRLDDLSPLRRTYFEGAPALVPAKVKGMLHNEYRYYDRPRYNSWTFNPQLRLWTTSQSCERYMREMGIPTPLLCPPQDNVPDCDPQDRGTCNRLALETYNATSQWTAAHFQEIRESPLDSPPRTFPLSINFRNKV